MIETAVSREIVPVVVQQHADDAISLRNIRSGQVTAPHVNLSKLRRLDDRIAAHLDGLAIAGRYGTSLAMAALAKPGRGEAFVAAVQAIETRDSVGMEKLLAVAEAVPVARSGVTSALGWVSPASLRGLTGKLLVSTSAVRREAGLAACLMHQVYPAAAVFAALEDADGALRARALRMAGETGRLDLLSACMKALVNECAGCAYEAARAAVLLGDRGSSVAALHAVASTPGPWRTRAASLILKLYTSAQANSLLRALSHDLTDRRLLIRGIGVAGDPDHVPWLVQQMHDLKFARMAGEAFSLMTGLDLAYLDMDRKPPENVDTLDSDPDLESVAMDEDDGLPWPDPDKIAVWWQGNAQRFTRGTRYFMGAPPSPAHCLSVLRDGCQRQRVVAAEYLVLMTPGTPMFNTSAPAWRQQRWLDKSRA